jgi:hypothetical protein
VLDPKTTVATPFVGLNDGVFPDVQPNIVEHVGAAVAAGAGVGVGPSIGMRIHRKQPGGICASRWRPAAEARDVELACVPAAIVELPTSIVASGVPAPA